MGYPKETVGSSFSCPPERRVPRFHFQVRTDTHVLLAEATDLPGTTEARVEASRRIGFASRDDGDSAACAKLRDGLAELNRELDVPSPREWGIPEGEWRARLGLMAEQALASGSPGNNPRVPTREEIVARAIAGVAA